MSVADKVKKFFHSIGIHSVTVQYECDDAASTDGHETESTVRKRITNDQTKVAGDCLLRCENAECETQTCCTKSSDRTNILLNNNDDHMEVFSISQPTRKEDFLQTQTSTISSSQGDKF